MIKLQLKQILNALIVSLFMIGATVTAAEVEAPMDMLKRTSDDVIKVLKEKREAIDADPGIVYQIVDDYIIPHLDDVTLAKLALGKNWRKASNEQKIEFVDQFRTLLVRTYSKSLQEFSDQKINFFAPKMKADATKVTVKSEVLQSGGPSIPVDYRLRLKEDEWKVYDIKIDGVSLVTNYRGTFAQEMRKGGMKAVLKMLQEKNAKVAEKPVAPETTNNDEAKQNS
ncbi:MAG: ABC transporter substrate-binding protein [Gammaproteobacteria bacterium]|nr:ABC transporter substrate-binding protein [Gammaproteobacteria bacterium]MCK5262048.1 ABC transporter substrate-binding protein [Gammaproteobacteria bacterium]